MAECINQCRIVTVYRSALSIGANELEKDLPMLVGCIIDKDPLSSWKQSSWSSQQVLFGPAATQRDSYSCGVYTIRNAIALMNREDPPRNIDNINDLRTQHAKKSL